MLIYARCFMLICYYYESIHGMADRLWKRNCLNDNFIVMRSFVHREALHIWWQFIRYSSPSSPYTLDAIRVNIYTRMHPMWCCFANKTSDKNENTTLCSISVCVCVCVWCRPVHWHTIYIYIDEAHHIQFRELRLCKCALWLWSNNNYKIPFNLLHLFERQRWQRASLRETIYRFNIKCLNMRLRQLTAHSVWFGFEECVWHRSTAILMSVINEIRNVIRTEFLIFLSFSSAPPLGVCRPFHRPCKASLGRTTTLTTIWNVKCWDLPFDGRYDPWMPSALHVFTRRAVEDK